MEDKNKLKEKIKQSIINSYPDLSDFNKAIKEFEDLIIKENKVWCSECSGEDEASVCKWCYQDAIKGKYPDIDKLISQRCPDHFKAGAKDTKEKILDKLRTFRERCLCIRFMAQIDLELFNDYYNKLESEVRE